MSRGTWSVCTTFMQRECFPSPSPELTGPVGNEDGHLQTEGHRERMYKLRVRKWGLRKNSCRPDEEAVGTSSPSEDSGDPGPAEVRGSRHRQPGSASRRGGSQPQGHAKRRVVTRRGGSHAGKLVSSGVSGPGTAMGRQAGRKLQRLAPQLAAPPHIQIPNEILWNMQAFMTSDARFARPPRNADEDEPCE